MLSEKLKKMKVDNEGSLPAYAFPGGYQILYLNSECDTICPDCANSEDNQTDEIFDIVDYFINWEGVSNFCADCNEEFLSEYGEIDKTITTKIPNISGSKL